jgi:hypothetical protein
MSAFFLVCAIVGVATLVLQVFGAGLHEIDVHADLHDMSGGHGASHDSASHGLHLFSIRALAAGFAFFGTTGWFAMRAGWLALLAIPSALLIGFVAMFAVAIVMRSMTRLESDGTMQIANAIGLDGRVHLSVPASGEGMGKVLLTVQGRLVELKAVTTGPEELATGSTVTVVDVRSDDVLEVRSSNSNFQDEV